MNKILPIFTSFLFLVQIHTALAMHAQDNLIQKNHSQTCDASNYQAKLMHDALHEENLLDSFFDEFIEQYPLDAYPTAQASNYSNLSSDISKRSQGKRSFAEMNIPAYKPKLPETVKAPRKSARKAAKNTHTVSNETENKSFLAKDARVAGQAAYNPMLSMIQKDPTTADRIIKILEDAVIDYKDDLEMLQRFRLDPLGTQAAVDKSMQKIAQEYGISCIKNGKVISISKEDCNKIDSISQILENVTHNKDYNAAMLKRFKIKPIETQAAVEKINTFIHKNAAKLSGTMLKDFKHDPIGMYKKLKKSPHAHSKQHTKCNHQALQNNSSAD